MQSQVEQPKCLMQSMMKMNKHIITNTNKESMNMPSQPTLLNIEVVHYFVDFGGLEEGDVGTKEPDATYNVDETKLLDDTRTPPSGSTLKSFLRFPVERVLEKENIGP